MKKKTQILTLHLVFPNTGETPIIFPNTGETPIIFPNTGETPIIFPNAGETPIIIRTDNIKKRKRDPVNEKIGSKYSFYKYPFYKH